MEFEFAVLSPTDLLDGTKATTSFSSISSVSSNQYKPFVSTFSLSIANSLPGDKIAYRYSRDARGSNADDTLAANIAIVRTRMTGVFWR